MPSKSHPADEGTPSKKRARLDTIALRTTLSDEMATCRTGKQQHEFQFFYCIGEYV